jgi:hypothetical protein
MNTSSDLDTESSETESPRVAPRRARIDGPHPVAAAEERAAVPATALAGHRAADQNGYTIAENLPVDDAATAEFLAAILRDDPDVRREQLELQAAQLAEHLRERLREVDRREAQLNSRVAQIEADLRTSRVWLREQEHDLAAREAELQRQLEDLAAGRNPAGDSDQDADEPPRTLAIADPSGTAASVSPAQEIAQREQAVILKENELRERRFELDRNVAALRHSQALWEQQQERELAALAKERERLAAEYSERWAQREAQLVRAESLLREQSEQLAEGRAALAADRRAWEERREAQENALRQRESAHAAQADEDRERLAARAEWIERERSGIEQVRSEVASLHRQALEMRLAAEQLWSQISGRMSPVEVTQSIAQIRRKLAESYRLEEEELAARRRELIELGGKIADQHRELTLMQTGLKGWLATRQEEIQLETEQLERRAADLTQEQEAIRHARSQWQSQRLRYEQEIRDLSAKLREASAAA